MRSYILPWCRRKYLLNKLRHHQRDMVERICTDDEQLQLQFSDCAMAVAGISGICRVRWRNGVDGVLLWLLSLFSLKIDFRIDLLVLYGLLVLIFLAFQVIEFVRFKDRLQHSNQYLVAQLESSILKLKEKTDNIEDEECVLESMKFGSQVLELASESMCKSLTFNEDLQTRPWWTPTSK
ncbi:hypothetical protein Ancab_008576 [Ancistrocladus abbreviatus]